MSDPVVQPTKRCHLAWHVTSRCNLACPHCLRRYPGMPTADLGHADCMRVLDSFVEFARTGGREARVEFSGGNPLLREDFPDLLRAVHAHKRAGVVKHIQILGNPETLDDATVERLRDAEVDSFFISLDGLEEANDRMRGPGSFAAGLRAIRALVAAGIRTSVKFTLVRDNADQIPAMIRLVAAEKAAHLGIGPLILAGGGIAVRDRALSPAEYRQVLLDVLRFLDSEADALAEWRRSFVAGNRMYALLFHELGRFDEYQELCRGQGRRGFGPRPDGGGSVLFVVWSDGEVVIRREMQRVGWVPRDSFQDIYDHSYMLHLLEDAGAMSRLAHAAQADSVKCSACPVASACLPAMAGVFGTRVLFKPNDHCWR